jgi:hypothetical protein
MDSLVQTLSIYHDVPTGYVVIQTLPSVKQKIVARSDYLPVISGKQYEYKDLIKTTPDFFEPLDADELALWE